MAALPPNGTARIFFDYTTGVGPTSKQHTTMLRTMRSISDHEDVQNVFRMLLAALGANNFRNGWRISTVRYSGAGSDFSVPVPILSNLATFVGTVSGNATSLIEATEDTFQGRSYVSGRRADISIYRAHQVPEATFRIESGSSGLGAVVLTAVNVLNNASAQGIICAIDGTPIVWAPYMNQNVNSYWERRQRS